MSITRGGSLVNIAASLRGGVCPGQLGYCQPGKYEGPCTNGHPCHRPQRQAASARRTVCPQRRNTESQDGRRRGAVGRPACPSCPIRRRCVFIAGLSLGEAAISATVVRDKGGSLKQPREEPALEPHLRHAPACVAEPAPLVANPKQERTASISWTQKSHESRSTHQIPPGAGGASASVIGPYIYIYA